LGGKNACGFNIQEKTTAQMISEIQDKARLSNIAGAKHLELI
jgi:hypothetical protein